MDDHGSIALVIIDYGMGNTASVAKACRAVGIDPIISRSPNVIGKARRLILPGVGAFGDGMENLSSFGLIDVISEAVMNRNIPILGICLGMQLMADEGFEYGRHQGLGWIGGSVKSLPTESVRLPHVGWNDIERVRDDVLFDNIHDPNFYFVHSYHFIPSNPGIVTATCNYGTRFVASVRKDSIFGTQFHPEKSQVSGLQLLSNFMKYAQN